MPPALAVTLGGACGALARYGVGRVVAHLVEQPFPWATWTVNLVGCLLIGMAIPLFDRGGGMEEAQFFLIVGFLGSFTTFSTYSLDTVALWGNGQGLLAVIYSAGSILCGLGLVVAGRGIGMWMFGG